MGVFERAIVPNNLLERIERLEEAVRALQRRDVEGGELDEFATDLGNVGSGRIERLQTSSLALQYVIGNGEEMFVEDGYVLFSPLELEVEGILIVDGKVWIGG